MRVEMPGSVGRGAVVADVTGSLAGFVAGPGAGPDRPLGEGGEALACHGDEGNEEDDARVHAAHEPVDAKVLAEAAAREGAVVIGRTTFDVSIDTWGAEPPLRKPCFAVTHRPAPSLTRPGGTSFTFVTSPRDALGQACVAVRAEDVPLGIAPEGHVEALHASLEGLRRFVAGTTRGGH